MEQRIAEAMQNENALLDDINRLETELEESAIRFTDAVENSKLREQELLSEIGSLKNEINSLREHVNNMEANADISSAVVEEHKKLLTEFEEKCQQNIKIQDALANLQSVLELFQQDFEKEKKQLVHQVNDANRKLEEFESASKEVEELRSEIKSRDEHIINLRDELRSFRKYASNLESDNAELRQRMQQTLARLENFSADEHLVDRRLVNQLLVAYVEGKRSRSEVLNLMANILQFSEEERTKIGLGTSNHNSSLLSTVVSMIAPRAIDESKFPLETSKNLADLWIDFLLDESTAKISTNLSRPAELVELSERSDSLHEHSESVEVNESNL